MLNRKDWKWELGVNVAAYRNELEAAGNTVILVDAGDAVQGAPAGTLSEGEYIIEIMNAMDYDLAVPGNHEFDYGTDRFFELAAMAERSMPQVLAALTELEMVGLAAPEAGQQYRRT